MLEKAAVYRHYNTDGDLLYVGASLNPFRRFLQHQGKSSWAYEAVNMTVEWYDSREDAETAEMVAISKEKPRYNIAGKPNRARDRYIPVAGEYGWPHVSEFLLAQACE